MIRHSLLVAAIALVAIAPAAAQPPTRPIELADYYRVEAVNGTALSPDGRTVAFVRTFIVEAENRRHSEIWTVPADGSTPPRRLTNPAFSSTAPRWSPDGRLLAFTSRRAAVEPAGPSPTRCGSCAWTRRAARRSASPASTARRSSAPTTSGSPSPRRCRRRRRGRRRRHTPFETPTDERFKGRIYDWMNARFDGRGYLADPRDPYATPPQELFVVARDGGTPRQLTTQGVDVQAPSWRPDSRALVFTSNMFERDEYVYERADIFTVESRRPDRPASPTTASITARRSGRPTGRSSRCASRASTRSSRRSRPFGSPTDLYRFPAGGGAPVNLTASWDYIPGTAADRARGPRACTSRPASPDRRISSACR